MYKTVLIILSFILSISAYTQVSPGKYWVKFTDKNNSPYSIDEPEDFLSQKAIERRENQGIEIVENDLPVNPDYIDAVEEIGVVIHNRSKWFNSVVVSTNNPSLIDEIELLPFVLSVEKSNPGKPNEISKEKSFFASEFYAEPENKSYYKSTTSFDYGAAYDQINQINGIPLHEAGFDGSGMVIAVLDAGFTNVDVISCFDSLWMNDRILGTRDFVDPGNTVFDHHSHGTSVLSTMGAWLPGEMVGTAPMASYYLFRTEDGDSEYLVEELNWAAGAELADSVGVDIINSSLGYSEFDDAEQDHEYSDMNGNTTPITIAADIAASKGILVVTSAGNAGDESWYYITAPADGDSVCTVGSVTSNGDASNFSSHGPTFDGRVKPDLMARGSSATIIKTSGEVNYGSGTSFSSPITAGILACLWQSSPGKTNMEVLEAARMSANFYNNPNENMGYGIPNYEMAMDFLSSIDQEIVKNGLYLYPNPFENRLIFALEDTSATIETISIFDLQGRNVYQKKINQKVLPYGKFILDDLNNLFPGNYLLQVVTSDEVYEKLIQKQ